MRLSFILILTILIAGFVTVSATIINVPDDYPTIQQGIDASAHSDTVLVQLGTYVENINFNGHNIVLGSLFLTTGDTSFISTTIIDGNSTGSVVTFENAEDSSTIITGFTIQNGSSLYGGGINCSNSSSPVITNNIITNNEAYTNNERGGSGGGIYCWNNSHPTILNNVLTENMASIDGGGIYCGRSYPSISNNFINGNAANISGGGINCSVNSIPSISNNLIIGNFGNFGGGISCLNSSNALISGNAISENSASSNGGAVYCIGSDPVIRHNVLNRNSAGENGGGINCDYSNPAIINNAISGNAAGLNGGGIYCDDSSIPLITNTIFWADSAAMGNEIYIQGESLSITYCDIQGGWDGEGNIDADPLFRNPEDSDYHLMATYCGDPYDSPCIDAGSPVFTDTLLDCSWGLGTERSDIGAFAGGYRSGRIINIPNDYPTIQDGINASSDRDTVLVQPGIYTENINFMGRNIIIGSLFLITGDTSFISSTIIDGDSSGSVVTFTNGENSTTAIIGFTLQNGFAVRGGGIYCDNSNPIISNNIITRNSVNAAYRGEGGGIYCFESNPIIRNNIISDNMADYTHYNDMGSGGGIYCDYANPVIRNNIIINNKARHGAGSGIFCDHSNPTIINCTFTENENGGIYCFYSDPIVINTILWLNSSPVINVYNGTPEFSYCDIQGGWEGEGNINLNPLFIDPDNGNYNICSQSPCIDAGDPNLQDPDGSRSDIGVYFPEHPECDLGNIWFVSISGNDDTGDGSPENPFRTIQHTIDISSYLDTIIVENGTYVENLIIDNSNIVLASNYIFSEDTLDIQNTIIDGDSVASVISFFDCDSLTMLKGFTIRNGTSNGINCNTSDPTIIHNIIYGHSISGITCNSSNPFILYNDIFENSAGGIVSGGGSNPIIMHNLIRENSGNRGGGIYCASSTIIKYNIIDGNTANEGGGIYSRNTPIIDGNIIRNNFAIDGGGILCDNVSLTEIINNYIFDNYATNGGGIYYDLHCDSPTYNNIIYGNIATNGGGIYCRWDNDPPFVNNTISGNSADSRGGGIYFRSHSNPIIINSIFCANSASTDAEIYIDSLAFPSFIYCDIQGGWEGEGNIDIDPLFRDSDNGDFHLMAIECDDPYDSPCIDAGHPVILDSLLDCSWGLGELRSDIGAFGGGDMGPTPYAPELISPVNDSIITEEPVFLIWHQIDYADTYMVCLSIDSLFQDTISIPVAAVDTTLNVTEYLSNSDIWYWCVKAHNFAGWGDWSEVWSFSVEFTRIDDPDMLIPDNYVLYQSYPNPFNNAATIKYGLPKQAYVSIQIYDILGRKVETLVNKEQAAGYHQTIWRAIGKSSGIYFYRIEAGDFTKSMKMLLLK